MAQAKQGRLNRCGNEIKHFRRIRSDGLISFKAF